MRRMRRKRRVKAKGKRRVRRKRRRSSLRKTPSASSTSGRAGRPPTWAGSPSPSASRRSLRVTSAASWR